MLESDNLSQLLTLESVKIGHHLERCQFPLFSSLVQVAYWEGCSTWVPWRRWCVGPLSQWPCCVRSELLSGPGGRPRTWGCCAQDLSWSTHQGKAVWQFLLCWWLWLKGHLHARQCFKDFFGLWPTDRSGNFLSASGCGRRLCMPFTTNRLQPIHRLLV